MSFHLVYSLLLLQFVFGYAPFEHKSPGLLVRNPKLLGVYLDTFFSFNAHCVQVANRVSKRNNVLKVLVGTNWGQQKETLLLIYKAFGRSIDNYAAPVWSINASDTSLEKIQLTQNDALRIITGSHKLSSIDHLHSETKMLLVKDYLNLLSAQYLVHCLDTENVCHHITTMDHPLFTRHNQTTEGDSNIDSKQSSSYQYYLILL